MKRLTLLSLFFTFIFSTGHAAEVTRPSCKNNRYDTEIAELSKYSGKAEQFLAKLNSTEIESAMSRKSETVSQLRYYFKDQYSLYNLKNSEKISELVSKKQNSTVSAEENKIAQTAWNFKYSGQLSASFLGQLDNLAVLAFVSGLADTSKEDEVKDMNTAQLLTMKDVVQNIKVFYDESLSTFYDACHFE